MVTGRVCLRAGGGIFLGDLADSTGLATEAGERGDGPGNLFGGHLLGALE